ncbi:MAG: transglycosylase SLT domain-containing protein [Acidobacteriota bacterium]
MRPLQRFVRAAAQPAMLLLIFAATMRADQIKFETLAGQIEVFVRSGDDAKAAYALQELERTDAQLFRANNYPYLAGIVTDRLGQRETARRYFTAALESRELSEYAAWQLAQMEKEAGKRAEQRVYLELVLSRPTSLLAPQAAYEHALSLLEDGAYEKALAGLTSRTLAGRDLLYERVRCLARLDRVVEAHRLVNDAMRRRSKSDGVLKALGLIELDETEEDLARLSNDDLERRADLYYANRNFERALFYYRILYDDRGQSSDDLIYAIGRSLDSSGKKADALAWFEDAEGTLRGTYRFWAVWFQGEILYKRQDFLRAEERYQRALPLAPSPQNDLSVRLRILSCQELSGQRERALATAREILGRHRSMFYYMKFRAVRTLAAEGKLADVVVQLDALLEAEPASRRAEILYWKAWTCQRMGNLGEAVSACDAIIRLYPSSFYATLAGERLAEASLASFSNGYDQELGRAEAHLASGRLEESRKLLSYLLHRYPSRRETTIQRLRDVYARLPKYRDFLDLSTLPPRGTIIDARKTGDRSTAGELTYLGCYADAAREMDAARHGRLVSLPALFSIADYYQRGGTAYMAMLRTESLIDLLPRDFEFDLLPARLKELLYPLNFTTIVDKAAAADLDLYLFYSLIRQESRFNTFARSSAGARGLLQFIPSTASQVQSELGGGSLHEDDLYDPDLSIRLGAYYVSKLSRQFSNAIAPVLASYNAGEEQGKLWLRMAGTSEIHQYLTEVNYPETRNYIVRILTDYYRYRAIYPGLAPKARAQAGTAEAVGARREP